MRTIRYLFLAALGVVLATVAFANREMVTLHLLPSEISGFLGYSWQVSLPLFIVIFLGIVAGLMIGFVWEWFREHRQRAEAKAQRRERDQLAREVQSLRGEANKGRDEVLALLED